MAAQVTPKLELINELPERLRERYSFSRAYVFKLGFLRFELTPPFSEQYFASTSEPPTVDPFVSKLYELLEQSLHIMDISPSRKIKGADLLI